MIQSAAEMSPAKRLFNGAVARLVETLRLRETRGKNGDAWLSLVSHAPFHQGDCGHVRLYLGDTIAKIVTCSITAPAIGLDSHMLFAFAPTDSAIPHFTLDSVAAGDQLAFHLDLIPRVDLATHLAYMDWAYGALNETFAQTKMIDGLSPALITPRQRASMSPWMLAYRACPNAFAQVGPLAQAYLTHWLTLLHAELPVGLLKNQTPELLAMRDRASRAVLFNPDVDKVWNQIRGLIGIEAETALRAQLLQTDGC